jgi:hypothetical protein
MSEKNDADFHVDTDAVIAELQAEGHEIEGRQVDVPEAQTPAEPEVPSQPEPEVTETPEVVETPEPRNVDRVPKEPTLIPAWKAKIAEDRLSKENAELRSQIEAFQSNPTRENREGVQQGMENVRELAQAYGLELDSSQEAFFNALVSSVAQKAVPQDLVQNIQALHQQKEVEYLETEYTKEFTQDVAPLIKERYGDVSDKELATLQKKLHDIAFTEQYAKVPLKKIFLAESEDLGIKASKESIVTHKSGRTRGTEIDLSNMDEDSFRSLDGDTLDKFIDQKSGKSSWSRR